MRLSSSSSSYADERSISLSVLSNGDEKHHSKNHGLVSLRQPVTKYHPKKETFSFETILILNIGTYFSEKWDIYHNLWVWSNYNIDDISVQFAVRLTNPNTHYPNLHKYSIYEN